MLQATGCCKSTIGVVVELWVHYSTQ
uniref:Uncharacterized protein n=1 Tax=Arundo donax TaxID=35708 RepID=A0A0A9AIH8_ARUDO